MRSIAAVELFTTKSASECFDPPSHLFKMLLGPADDPGRGSWAIADSCGQEGTLN